MADPPLNAYGQRTSAGPGGVTALSAPAPAGDTESALLESARNNPGLATGIGAAALLGPGAVGAVTAGAAYDYLKEKLYGRGTEGLTKGQADVETETLARDRAKLPDWATGATEDVVVGYTRGGMQPHGAQQQKTTERQELPLPYWAHSKEAYAEDVQGAKLGAQAKHREQEAMYDLARDLEDDRREYADNERRAADRFSSDTTNARIRLDQAREKLARFGDAPKATVAAAFEKANGLQKVMGLAGMLMGGVSAAGFSALSHRPEKNPFFEQFRQEAGAVIDKFMTDRDTAGKELAAEREGMEAIRQSFADERASREFVMGAVLNTYKAKLEQIAAQFGIDRNRADYQHLLAQIDRAAADSYKVAATRIQDTVQESQKYVAPQPIKVRMPVAAATARKIDPKFAKELESFQREAARFGAREYWPKELVAKEKDLLARQAVLSEAIEQAGAQHMFGPQSEDLEDRIGGYGDARDKRGINDLEDVSLAADRIARKMARMGDTGWLQQYANAVAAGHFSQAAAAKFLAQHVAPDTELYNDLAYVTNAYSLAQGGKSLTANEIGRVLTAVGSGDAEGVANFNNNLKRSINSQESQLIAQYGLDAARVYHGRRQYLQDTQTPLPHLPLKSPE